MGLDPEINTGVSLDVIYDFITNYDRFDTPLQSISVPFRGLKFNYSKSGVISTPNRYETLKMRVSAIYA